MAERIKTNRTAWEENINMSIGLGKKMQNVYKRILENDFQENIKKLLK